MKLLAKRETRDSTPPRCRCRLVRDEMWEVDDFVSVRGTRCKALISRRLFMGVHIYPTASLRLPVNPQVCCPIWPHLCPSQCFSWHGPCTCASFHEVRTLPPFCATWKWPLHTYIHTCVRTYIHMYLHSCTYSFICTGSGGMETQDYQNEKWPRTRGPCRPFLFPRFSFFPRFCHAEPKCADHLHFNYFCWLMCAWKKAGQEPSTRKGTRIWEESFCWSRLVAQ